MNYKQGFLSINVGGTRSGKSATGVWTHLHFAGLKRHNPMLVITDWALRDDDPVYQIPTLKYITVHDSATAEERIEQLKPYNPIIIDECQFYKHLREVVVNLLFMGKIIYICGLDGDFKARSMGETFSLIPICNEFIKHTGECVTCVEEGRDIINPAIRTIRVDGRKKAPTIEIAGLEVFKPVCREHDNLTLEDLLNPESSDDSDIDESISNLVLTDSVDKK